MRKTSDRTAFEDGLAIRQGKLSPEAVTAKLSFHAAVIAYLDAAAPDDTPLNKYEDTYSQRDRRHPRFITEYVNDMFDLHKDRNIRPLAMAQVALSYARVSNELGGRNTLNATCMTALATLSYAADLVHGRALAGINHYIPEPYQVSPNLTTVA